MRSNIPDTSAMDRPVARPRRRRGVVLVLAIGAVLVAVFVVRPLVARWSAVDRSVDRARLRLATVTRGELLYQVAVQGRVVAASRPTLFARSTGIVALSVREGESVAAGQVLASLESPELMNRRQQEEATLDSLTSEIGRLELETRQQNLADDQRVELLVVREQAAQRSLERAERLGAEGLLNSLDLEAARDDLTIQTLELAQARRNEELQAEMREFALRDARARRDRQRLELEEISRRVEELTIRAPFDGLVATVEVEDRDAVVAGQALLGIVDLGDLEVAINIPEAYADEVVPGLSATVQIGSEDHPAVVTRVAPEVRNSQVEGRIKFTAGTPEGLRQNQRLSTRVILDHREDTLKVARGPFLEAGGGRRVWVVEDDLAQSRTVELGAVSITEVEVLSGLSEGEEIVLSDLSRFDDTSTLMLRD